MRSINVVTDGIQAQVGVLYGAMGSIMQAGQLFWLVGIRDGKSGFVERGTAVGYVFCRPKIEGGLEIGGGISFCPRGKRDGYIRDIGEGGKK